MTRRSPGWMVRRGLPPDKGKPANLRDRGQETGILTPSFFYFFFENRFRNWAVGGSEREAWGRKAATWSGPTGWWISGLESG